MHAFMAAILLRMAGLDSFNANPQPEPPDCQLAQVEQGMRGSEGHAVIAADVGGQAALLKKPLKHSKSVVFAGRRESFAGKQKTAGVIGDGQRVAVVMIAEQEFSLVVGAPQLVGLLPQRQSGSLCTTTPATAAFDQTVAIQHRMDGALGRNRNAGEPADQALANLPSTPAGVLALHVQNIVLHLEGKLVSVTIGATTPIGQSLHSAVLVAIEDFVAGLARDPELPAK